jgi:sugar O-acyltransferase (sialic acid O-acetyltransferase NeuD family)
MELWIFGSGGHAKVVAAAWRAAGGVVAGFVVADETGSATTFAGAQVFDEAQIVGEGRNAFIAIGDNRVRARLAAKPAWTWGSVIHPHSWVDPSVRIGEGTVVCAGVIIQPDALVGDHVILNTGCSVDHDCNIGSFAQIGPGARLAGNVTVEEGATLGTGAVVLPGIRIGQWAVVGAGAVVTRNVPDGDVVVGVPARLRPPASPQV